MTKISIVIPVYKAESTLSRCIESIRVQSYQNWELILVDDGSPDLSGTICDHYAESDKRINSFHIPNGGVGNARNYGLNKCKSKWVTFVDSDDSLEPDYIANFHIEEHFNSDGIIIMQGYRRVTPFKEPLGEKIDLQNADYYGDDFLERAINSDKVFEYGQVVGKLYDLSLIKKQNIRFPTEFNLSEDHMFYLMYLSKANRIITYNGTLYNYIWEQGPTGLSRSVQPYKTLFTRFHKLVTACDNLKKNRNFSSETIEKFNYFSVTGSLALLLKSLYQQEEEKTKRIEILKRILSKRQLIITSFWPRSLKGKFFKQILLTLPISLCDYLLKLIYNKR